MTVIALEGVGKRIADRWILRDASVQIGEGETFVLIGPSGSGKSTALKTINRLVHIDAGRVLVRGVDVAKQDDATLRRSIGYVIQDVGLFAHYDVRRNVGVVPELLGWERSRIARRVEELLERVGMPAGEFGRRHPRELSGGQRQRVGIARALAADPSIVLLDEPFSALDPIQRERLQDEFVAWSRSFQKTFVLVTHDIVEACRLATRIAVVDAGRIVQVATPREIVDAPANDTVLGLLARHRFQLRMMTRTVRDDLPTGALTSESPTSPSVQSAPDDSLWDVLSRLEREHAALARVTPADAAPRFASRADLLAAASLGVS